MSTLKKIAIPKVGKGGAGSYHHHKIRASISWRFHQYRPLPKVRYSRDKEVMKKGIIVIGLLPRGGHERTNRVYSLKGISPTLLTAMGLGGGTIPMFLEVKKV